MCQALYEIMKDDIDIRVQQGMQQGMQQGIQQGMRQGVAQEKVSNIKTLMETMNWNPIQAMNALRIPEEDRQKYSQLLTQ